MTSDPARWPRGFHASTRELGGASRTLSVALLIPGSALVVIRPDRERSARGCSLQDPTGVTAGTPRSRAARPGSHRAAKGQASVSREWAGVQAERSVSWAAVPLPVAFASVFEPSPVLPGFGVVSQTVFQILLSSFLCTCWARDHRSDFPP